MRKICVFALVVFLVGVMAVPAFASSGDFYSGDIVDGWYASNDASLFNGDYLFYLYASDGALIETFELHFDESEFQDKSYTFSYLGRDDYFLFIVLDRSFGMFDFQIEDGFYGSFVIQRVGSEASLQVGSITGVLSQIGSFVVFALGSLGSLFWTGSSLTFFGVLGVCGLAFGVVLLIVYLVARYFRFRSG